VVQKKVFIATDSFVKTQSYYVVADDQDKAEDEARNLEDFHQVYCF